jgi:benzoyl-CoA reductase/2-hydroxyglutaryl-CoA dehydratase subunit BcrC/BadD/HgdB
MNDKCAAGTGRFLEKAASLLELTIDRLGEESVLSDNPAAISTQCVVFAESEIISLRAKGYAIRDIAAGVHLATAKRVVTLLNRLGVEPGVFFSGGVSNNIGMRKAIECELNTRNLPIKIDAIHTGALGAAALAAQAFREGAGTGSGAKTFAVPDLRQRSEVSEQIEERKRELIRQNEKPLAAYMCSYTPLEIFSAAEIPAIRLFTAGNTEEVASGEVITQSVFCDFVKSILGKFQMQDPLYKRVDKIFGFYTCDCIKKVCEATDEFFTPTELYVLPRMKNRADSRGFYREEILNFRDDAEKLSGHGISDESVASQIKLYNEIRRTLEEISALRKRPDPPLTGEEFLDLTTAYYYLPPDRLLRSYKKALDRLSAVPDTGRRPIRIMMAGGIVAEGDRRLIHLIEKHMGARVVAEDHCTGVKIAKTRIRESGDPYEALAEGYIDQSPCARMKPLEDRILYSGDLAEEYAVDGVVYAYLKFCPCYGQTKHKFFQYYQTLGIPVLELPIDYSKSDEGQMKTRLEAFVEVLKESLVSQDKAAI